MNEVTLSEKTLEAVKRFAYLEQSKKEIEEASAKVRAQILTAMQENGLTSFENDVVKLTRVAGSSSVSIDSKRFKESEPDKYFDYLDKYPKVTERKESLRIKIK